MLGNFPPNVLQTSRTWLIESSRYHFSGAKTLVAGARTAKGYMDQAKAKFQESTPDSPNEALEWLRQSASSYVAFIPGAKGYVDTAFKDLDAIRAKHGDQVDELVSDAYHELKDISKEGMSVETATKAWDTLKKYLDKIGSLASDAMSDIMDNHPEIKEKVGGNLDQLKKMGDKLGPDAKKQVDETWDQIKSILAAGVSVDAINRIKKLVQDKTEQVKKLGDQAWDKGLKEAKPYFDKAPKAKELIEQNTDVLKSGNIADLWEKVKEAAKTGDTSDLEKFIKNKASQAQKKMGGSGGGGMGNLESYAKMIPGGEKIIPQLSQLSEIASKHGKEAQKLAEEAYDEIAEVLKRKVGEAQKIAEKAKKDAKN